MTAVGWDDLLRAGVTVAKTIVADGLEATVLHLAAVGQNTYGETAYPNPAVARRAVVTDTNTIVRTPRGEEVVARYRVLFLESVAVDPRDRLTLPDGRVGPILKIDHGVLDDAGGRFYTEVWVG